MSNYLILAQAMQAELEKLAMMGMQKNPNSAMGGGVKITAPAPPKPMPNHLPSATAPKMPASQVIGTNVAQKRVNLPTNIVGGK